MPAKKPTLRSIVENWVSKGRTELVGEVQHGRHRGVVSVTLRQRRCACCCAKSYTPKLTTIQRLEIETLIEKLKEFFKKVVQEIKDFGTGLTFILVPQAS